MDTALTCNLIFAVGLGVTVPTGNETKGFREVGHQGFRLMLIGAHEMEMPDGIVIGLTGDKPDISSAKVPADLLATGIRQAVKMRTPVSIGYPTVDLDTLE